MFNDVRLEAMMNRVSDDDGLVIDTAGVRERPLIPQGEHILILQKTERKRVNSTFSKEPDGKIEKLMFAFTSTTLATGGKPYEYTVWTGVHYGDKRAALTLLLDMLIPELQRGMQVRIADLVGRQYRAYIQHKTNANTGKVYAGHMYIVPIAMSTPAQGNPQAQASAPVLPTNAAVTDAGMTAPVRVNGSVPPTGATPAPPQPVHVPAVAVPTNGTDAPMALPMPAVPAPPDDADTTLSQW